MKKLLIVILCLCVASVAGTNPKKSKPKAEAVVWQELQPNEVSPAYRKGWKYSTSAGKCTILVNSRGELFIRSVHKAFPEFDEVLVLDRNRRGVFWSGAFFSPKTGSTRTFNNPKQTKIFSKYFLAAARQLPAEVSAVLPK